MIAKQIINKIYELAPLHLIDDWDNCGLQLGSNSKEVTKLLLALDITTDVVEKALEDNVDMIIVHHPIFFNKISSLDNDSRRGKMIYKLIKNDIVVFSVHSNLDSCIGGVNDALASTLELTNVKVLRKTYEEKLYKLVVYVPIGYSDKVRNAISEAGAGWIGNYSHCTYNITGVGTFMPREGTNPFIGTLNKIEKVEEVRIETIVREGMLNEVIDKMLAVHPYEEVAYDVYPLLNKGLQYGYGRIGELKDTMTLSEFAEYIKKKLNCDTVRIYGDIKKRIKRVSLCGGSGSEFIRDSYYKRADVYVTGDIKYHDAQLAYELDLPIIDAGHFNTEWVILPELKNYLLKSFEDKVEILLYESNGAPFELR